MTDPRSCARMVLGTVQLGMRYGIANTAGRPDMDTARGMVDAAWRGGVRVFDTAQAYGESEAVLGRVLADLGLAGRARCITKLAPSLDCGDADAVRRSLEESMARLGMDSLAGVMLHNERQLDAVSDAVLDLLAGMRRDGLVGCVGASVYGPQRALEALRRGFDCIQIPGSVLDRRFERAGVLDAARDGNTQVFMRSIFLQGLLVFAPDALPPHMAFARPVAERVHACAARLGLRVEEMAVGFMKAAYPDARILFGAETVAQVEDNLRCWGVDMGPDNVALLRETFSDVGDDVLNPNSWPKPAAA